MQYIRSHEPSAFLETGVPLIAKAIHKRLKGGEAGVTQLGYTAFGSVPSKVMRVNVH